MYHDKVLVWKPDISRRKYPSACDWSGSNNQKIHIGDINKKPLQ